MKMKSLLKGLFTALGAMFTALGAMASAHAHETIVGEARAILNEGVLVESGEAKVLFDPLYDEGFGTFPELDPELRAAIITGAAPYDRLDAVFVSHFHGDHFSAPGIVKLLLAQPDVQLFAPAQAVAALQESEDWEARLADQVNAVSLENGDAAIVFEIDDLHIEALRTPHIGWPKNHAQVENITFRVTLDDGARVMHLGDADRAPQHFAPHAEFFGETPTHMGFAPFWFLSDAAGAAFLKEALNIDHAVGVHVPIEVPEPLKASGADYFNELGETREIHSRD